MTEHDDALEAISRVTCIWCQKVYHWDWEQDRVMDCAGELSTVLVDVTNGMSLEVYLCAECQGVLAIVTEEPHGSSLLIHETNS